MEKSKYIFSVMVCLHFCWSSLRVQRSLCASIQVPIKTHHLEIRVIAEYTRGLTFFVETVPAETGMNGLWLLTLEFPIKITLNYLLCWLLIFMGFKTSEKSCTVYQWSFLPQGCNLHHGYWSRNQWHQNWNHMHWIMHFIKCLRVTYAL